MDMVVSLFIAFLLDWFLPSLPNHFHPVSAMGFWIRTASQAEGGGPCNRFWYGILFVIGGCLFFALPGLFVELYLTPYPFIRVVVNALLLWPVFSLRSLLKAGEEVYRYLDAGDIMNARKSLAWHLVSRDTLSLEEGHLASGVIESLAENLTDSVIAPTLVFLVGGLPLAWAYRFINTADAMIGYHTPRFEYLGKAVARLDDALNWIPARLSAWMMIVASYLRGAASGNAWHTMIREHGHTESPNAGWTMSVAAGALRVMLEKKGCYVIKGGDALPGVTDIQRASALVLTAAWIWLGSILLIFTGVNYGF